MSTFGADIGVIWRSDLDTTSKAVLTGVRYHGDDAGVCDVGLSRIMAISGVGRSTVLQRLADLVVAGWVERVSHPGGRNTYRVTPPEGIPVRHTDPSATRTRPPHGRGGSATRTGGVRHTDGSPTPPNKEIQTSSRLLPDVAADAPTPAPATPDFLAVERAYLDATGGGLMVKHVEASALKALTDTHGPAAVIVAIEEAVLANTRGRVSVNFVRAILERKAGATPPRQEPRGPGYVMPPDPKPLQPPREETDEERAAVLAAWREI